MLDSGIWNINLVLLCYFLYTQKNRSKNIAAYAEHAGCAGMTNVSSLMRLLKRNRNRCVSFADYDKESPLSERTRGFDLRLLRCCATRMTESATWLFNYIPMPG